MSFLHLPSFGRRKARKLRVTSQTAYEEILPLVKLDLTMLPVNTQTSQPPRCHAELVSASMRSRTIPAFAGTGPGMTEAEDPDVWLEIGFGGGEHMLEQLAKNPTIMMVGCEPFMNGVAKFLTQLSPEDYHRVRIWHEDVRLLLDKIPPQFFERAFILFPDPWPKKRHHPRRLITHEFMDQLLPTLREGALLHVASDDAAYVEQIQNVLYRHPNLVLCEGPPSADPTTWGERPEGWPPTRYEQKAMTQSKKCAYMVLQKKENKS